MKKTMTAPLIFLLLIAFTSCSKSEEVKKVTNLKTDKQKSSYSVGYDMGRSIKDIADEINLEALIQGMQDAVKGSETQIPKEEMPNILNQFRQEMWTKQQEKRKILAEKNKTEGEAFLKENAGKPGVKTTKSGLQYLVIKEGSGPSPKATDRVKVHYNGVLVDGTEFDSSFKRGEPAVFPLDRVIKGWTEGLQLMKPGARYKFFVPSELAYGERGAGGGLIGPNAVLMFEVELLGIEPPEEKKEEQKGEKK